MSEIFKVILAGDGGVGKTTLIYRLRTGSFMEGTKMTIGVDFYPYETKIDAKTVVLQIWDLGGQDRFQFMHQAYVKGGAMAILVYDLSRLFSLKAIIDVWIPIVRTYNRKLPLILVGTKLDLITEDDVARIQQDPIIQSIHALAHFMVSSKTGVGVDDLFQYAAQKLLELRCPTPLIQ
jgi:small GTP-binding protein